MENNNGMEMVIDATVDENGRVVESKETTTILQTQAEELKPVTINTFNSISEERQVAIREFVTKIDLYDKGIINNFGNKVLQDISKKNSEIIESDKGTEAEQEVKKQLAIAMGAAKKVKNKPYFLSTLFKNANIKYDDIRKRYKDLNKVIMQIDKKLFEQQEILRSNLNEIEEYIDFNDAQIRRFEDYIISGEMALEDARKNIIPTLELEDKSVYNPERIKFMNNITTYERKLADLQYSRSATVGFVAEAWVVYTTTQKYIEAIDRERTHTLASLIQMCAIALKHEKNKIAGDMLQGISETTEKMIKSVSQDIKLEAIEAAKRASEGFLDPSCIEGMYNDIKEGISRIEQYSNAPQILNEGLEKIAKAERELRQVLSNDTEQKKTITSNASGLTL